MKPSEPGESKPEEVRVKKGFADRLRNAETYLRWIAAIAIVVAGYFVYQWAAETYQEMQAKVEDTKKAISDTVEDIKKLGEVSVKSLECPSTMRQGGALCYDICPAGWESDGTHSCYQPCPAGWPGGETLTHCQHKTSYSTVGADASLSIPSGCLSGKTSYLGLCYSVPAGWEITSPGFIAKKCPDGWRSDGVNCWKDMHTYGRGTGYAYVPIVEGRDDALRRCEASEGKGRCERSLEMYYPKCKPGYVARGCCLCERPPEVRSKSVTSQIGTLPDKCPAGRELVGRLCYPQCPTGTERRGDNLEFCSSICPSGFLNIGIGGCQKPSKWVDGRGLTIVGICPSEYPVRKGDLCYRANS